MDFATLSKDLTLFGSLSVPVDKFCSNFSHSVDLVCIAIINQKNLEKFSPFRVLECITGVTKSARPKFENSEFLFFFMPNT